LYKKPGRGTGFLFSFWGWGGHSVSRNFEEPARPPERECLCGILSVIQPPEVGAVCVVREHGKLPMRSLLTFSFAICFRHTDIAQSAPHKVVTNRGSGQSEEPMGGTLVGTVRGKARAGVTPRVELRGSTTATESQILASNRPEQSRRSERVMPARFTDMQASQGERILVQRRPALYVRRRKILGKCVAIKVS